MNLSDALLHSAEVDGWLTPAEGEALYNLAREVESSEAIVELGSWQGRSTIMLAAGSNAGLGATVFAVDCFQPLGDTASFYSGLVPANQEDYLGIFSRNLENAELASRVQAIKSSTVQAAQSWAGPSVGLLFIDADHTYKAVRGDFLSWLGHCSPGAVIAFHDYLQKGHPGVARFVDRLIITGVLANLQVAGSLLYGNLVPSPASAIRKRLALWPGWIPGVVTSRLATRIRIRGGLLKPLPREERVRL